MSARADDHFRAFCEGARGRLVGALSLYTGDTHLGEELAQEALVKACLRWSAIQHMDDPVAWVWRVAMNLAKSHFRRSIAERRAKEKWGGEYARSATIHDETDGDYVRQAVSTLKSRQRTALILRYYVGFSVKETAKLMGCPEGTVKTLVSRALRTLRTDPRLSLEDAGGTSK